MKGALWGQEEECCSPNATVRWRRTEWFAGLFAITTAREGLVYLTLFFVNSL